MNLTGLLRRLSGLALRTYLFIGGPEHRKSHSVDRFTRMLQFAVAMDVPTFNQTDPLSEPSVVQFAGERYHRKTMTRVAKVVKTVQYGVVRDAEYSDRVDVFVHESVDEAWLKRFVEYEVMPRL